MADFDSPITGEDDPIKATGSRDSEEVASELSSEAVIASDEERPPALSFPVVALGASAGGLEAFTRVLQSVPDNTGMAFVLVQHLAPLHASQLSSLLTRATSMPVMEVEEGTQLLPDNVFVIPPNTVMSVSDGVLGLSPRLQGAHVPMPIDHFFRSLAEDQKSGAIAIVLSGTDSDGAQGLQAIREQGGLTIAQSENSAKFPGMPHSAVGAGPVDLILSPEEIGRELGRIGKQGLWPIQKPEDKPQTAEVAPVDEESFATILALLRKATGIDFRGYKRGTIYRRVARRMLLRRLADLREYTSQLETDASELSALYEDILINVTSFFRDPDTFLALKQRIAPELLKSRPADSPIRVWVPGCSTGQEVYSVAICLIEAISDVSPAVPITLFGTDLSERVLWKARSGFYTESEISDVSEERRQRFFVKVENGYQIVKSVRELCVFARQNIGVDPPFSRLNLISCRNVMIYLGPMLQRQVITTFHYSLQPKGYLLLGNSENLRGFSELFSPVDKQLKFFKRSIRDSLNLPTITRTFAQERQVPALDVEARANSNDAKFDVEKAAERIVLREYGPAWVVVNEDFEIIHARGDTSLFLQLPPGAPSFNLLKMAKDSLRGELRKLLAKMTNENLVVDSNAIHDIDEGESRRVGLTVRRILDQVSEKRCFLVIFSSRPERLEAGLSGREREADGFRSGEQAELELLRDELAVTIQRLQGIIDERDAANQELTSANEEIQSSNEELQSINEELETAKEELQSSNEELSTLNEELQSRNQELGSISDDLSNLMSSTTIPILLLDGELRIRRMTPVTEDLLGIRPGDLGRPVGDIRMRLSVEDVESLAKNVLLTLVPKEVELQDREGRWRELRLRPYRTSDNRIGGVVLALIDVDQQRRAKGEATAARKFAESVVEAVQVPLLVLHPDLGIRLANSAFYREYGFQPAEVANQPFLEIGQRQWDLPGLGPAVEEVLISGVSQELEFGIDFPDPRLKNVCIHVHPIQPDGERLVLVVLEDITAQKNAARILIARQEELKASVEAGNAALHESEAALIRSRGELRDLAASLLTAQESERRRISRELHDDLSQKVAKLQFDIEILEQKVPQADAKDAKQRFRSVRDQVGALADDLRRVAHGLHPSSLDHLGLPVALRSYTQEFSRTTAVRVCFTSQKIPRNIPLEVASCIYRIVQEALRNVGKYAADAEVTIKLSGKTPAALDLSIRDNGPGFNMDAVRSKGGLGLISMQERVRLVQGRFSLVTRPGHGVHISIQVPLHSEAL